MEEIKKLLKEVLNREFIRAVISSPKEKKELRCCWSVEQNRFRGF